MEISQIDLFFLFLYSAATGVALGVIYDAIRILRALVFSENEKYLATELPLIRKTAYSKTDRKISRASLWIFVAVGDFIFMITCAVAVILVAYVRNMGRMRWLIPLGTMVGFWTYYVTVGKLILKISELVAFLIRAGFVYVYTFLEIPVRCAANKIKNRKKKTKENEKRRRRWHIGKKSHAEKKKAQPKRVSL